MHVLVDFIECARRPLTMVEVGAHHGAYAVLMGQLLRLNGGRCIAIEQAASNLVHHPVPKCSSEQPGRRGHVSAERHIRHPGGLSISDRGNQNQLVAEGQGETVTVKTLAQILREQGLAAVDLLLIDVEGATLTVLRGFPS